MSYIDFRVRPPYKSFLNTGIVKRWRFIGEDKSKWPATAVGRKPVPSLERGDIDLLIHEMDEGNVSKIVVWGRRSTDTATGFSNVPNDEIAELCATYPDRIIPFGGIDPHEPGGVKEIERCVKELGFYGMAIDATAAYPALHVNDERLFDYYAALQDVNGILGLSLSVFFGPDISYTDPYGVNIIARKFPQLRIVVSHACWPLYESMIGVAMTCPNVYICPDAYFYVPGIPMAGNMIEAANGPLKNKILFGSSYPIRGVSQCVEDWKALPLTPEVMRRSMYDNAAELLGL